MIPFWNGLQFTVFTRMNRQCSSVEPEWNEFQIQKLSCAKLSNLLVKYWSKESCEGTLREGNPFGSLRVLKTKGNGPQFRHYPPKSYWYHIPLSRPLSSSPLLCVPKLSMMNLFHQHTYQSSTSTSTILSPSPARQTWSNFFSILIRPKYIDRTNFIVGLGLYSLLLQEHLNSKIIEK